MLRELLGRYQLADVLGEGAMGTVHRGHDQRLSRDVAIKLLRQDALADEDTRRRFRREALALSKLNHPNVASIFDFDTADGTDFIVMELVSGQTLKDRLRQGPLGGLEVLKLGIQLADGLEAAHREGVIHRDLKPGNLRVTTDGRLKILDFGLARDLATAGAEVDTMTGTSLGLAVGTPAYMAPEQVRGEVADERSDVYGAGAVLYELTTGRQPYAGSSTTLLFDAVLNQPVVSPRALNPRVSPGLEAVILKALDKQPDQRYQSAKELGVDLHRLLAAESARSVTAVTGPPGAGGRTKRRWALGLSAASLAVAAAVVAVWLMSARTTLSFAPRDWILVADVQNETGNPLFDRSLTTAFRVSLEQSNHANVLAPARVAQALERMGKAKVERLDEDTGREICLRENTRGLVTSVISRVGSQYVLAAHLIDPTTGDRVRTYSERVDREDDLLDALDRIALALRHDLGESLATIRQGSRPLPQVTTRSLKALQLYSDGSYLWTKGDYHNAMRQFQAALNEDADFAMAHAAIGGAFVSFIYNNRVDGRKHLDRALELSERTSDRERLAIQVRHAQALGTPEEAERLLRLYLSKYPDDVGVRYDLGSALMHWEREDEAIQELREVVRIAPTYAAAYINLATSLRNVKEYKESLANYEKAFALQPDWKTGGNLNHEYGFAFVEVGEPDKAREVFGLALARPAHKGRALRSLALLDVYEGRHRRAITGFREAALTNETSKFALSAARDRLLLAATLDAVGDRSGARGELDAARRLLASGRVQVWMYARVGQAYARLGDPRHARELRSALTPYLESNNAEQLGEVHVLDGEIALAEGRVEAARDGFAQAFRERPWPLTLEPLARGEVAAGHPEAGIERYRELLGTVHRSLGWEGELPWLNAHYECARLLAARGQRDEARQIIDELLRLWQSSDGSPTLLAASRALRATLN